MRAYERNGITIDQCADCRGIFLDRGELDRLIDAEGAHYQSSPQSQFQGDSYRRNDDYRDRDDDRHGHDYREYGHKKKRHSFLSELFDD